LLTVFAMKKPRTPAAPSLAPLGPADLSQVTGGDGTAPADSVSGNSTGRRQYKPVEFTA